MKGPGTMFRFADCLMGNVCHNAFFASLFDRGVTVAETAEEAKKKAERTDEPLFLGEETSRGKVYPCWVFYSRRP